MSYRLLALDVDGTLLDPTGNMRPAVQQAVMAVQQRGVHVVLCTGRRFRTALPLAQALKLEAPLIVHNGALVKMPSTGETLYQTYMPMAMYQQAIGHLRQLGSPMVYVDAFPEHVDIFTEPIERAHPFQQAYLQDNLAHCRFVETVNTLPTYGVVMMSIMGDGSHFQALRRQLETQLGAQGRVHLLINKNYQGYILEILQASASKWQGLQQVATHEGIAAEAIVAIGDDENDLDMIRHAGLGIAMGNAKEAVKTAADHITGSNAEDGLIQAIERFLLH